MESLSNFYVEDYLVSDNGYVVEHKIAAAGDDKLKVEEEEEEYQQVMAIDDLLDFPNDEDQLMMTTRTTHDDDALFHIPANSADSSATQPPPPHHYYSPTTFPHHYFSNSQLFLPCEDLAELEWVSNFVDESFSSDEMRNLHFIPTTASCHHHNSPTDTCSSEETVTNKTNSPTFSADVAVPGKARSKRSRAAPCDWSSRILHLSPAAAAPPPPLRKRESTVDAPGRRCLHCASEKTPQWRTGPLGPKTLCNACGVRYKSGRLVPEYRPAASPTFVSAKHSNSHRKVVELRRQKELRMGQLSQSAIFGVSNADDAYLIHAQSGRDFRNTNI